MPPPERGSIFNPNIYININSNYKLTPLLQGMKSC